MTNNDLSSEGVVKAFCAAWDRSDLSGVLSMLSDDVNYQNVPAPAMIGRAAVRNFIAPLISSATKIEFIVKALAVAPDGLTVLTERIDKLHYGDKTVVLPLMGVFVVKEGHIVEWRDYVDSALVAKQFGKLS